MGIFFRDKNLKEMFKKTIQSDLVNDLSERIENLVNFAYNRLRDNEMKKKEEK